MTKRVGSPLGVALVAAVLAALVAALVLSFVLEDEEGDAAPVLTLDPNVQDGGITIPPNTNVNEQIPDFTFQTLDGDEVDFDEFRDGRPAVVNFFAENCAPCVIEMPELEEAHQQYGDEIAFLGLSEDRDPADAEALVERTGVTYATGWDQGSDVLVEQFEGTTLPTSVFIRADGTVTTVYGRRVHPPELARELEALVT